MRDPVPQRRRSSGSTRRAEALEQVLRDLRMYKIGRQVEIADRTGERAMLSLIGPASRELAADALGGTCCCPISPSTRSPRRARPRRDAAAGRDRPGVDLLGRARDASTRRRACSWPRAPSRSARRPPRSLRIEAAAPRLGIDMTRGEPARRGGHRRAGGELHQGLLRRPGAGRPHVSPRPPEPASARAAAAAPVERRARRCSPASARSAGHLGRCLAAPRPDRARDRAARGRARRRGARSAPAAPAATVVELPFG